MRSFLFPVAVLISAAMAQTTACAADYIVESCLGSEKAKLAACNSGDYECQCAAWQAILTCYNNCPNDSRLHTDMGQKDIFCGYATQFPSKATTAASPSKTGSSSSATQTPNQNQDDDDSTTGTNDESETSTSTGSPATNTNSAAYLALNAGGVLAAVAGVVAVVL